MALCDDLLNKARRSPNGLRFGEVCALAECWGFRLVRTKGNHHLYKRSGVRQIINLQSVKGEAKPYQVRQLIRAIDQLRDGAENA